MQPGHLKAIKQILAQNPFVVFAYFYGSSKDSEVYNDIDIAVFSTPDSNPFRLSVDVRVINHLIRKGDLFSLLYLRDVLSQGELLLDNDFPQRASFIEAFSMKYRECEGLIAEVCA
jgi:hypothetical protein